MNKTIGGILLVAGTTVGAGMLALPVATGFAGFWPSVALFLVYWVFMTYTAFLILEVNLWVPKKANNMITMAEMTLGPVGKVVSWIAYLFLLYALTTAYLAGGGPLLNGFLGGITGWQLPKFLEALPLLLIFGYFVYRGTHSVDYLNRWLMLGLVGTYLLMVVLLMPHVQGALLQHVDLKALGVGSSIVATSFGFHIIIPSLTNYLDRDVKQLKKVILIGSAIPLVVYLIWQLLVLGIVPLDGEVSLASGFREGTNGANLLSDYLGHSSLAEIAQAFSLLAIVTSFLGVSTSLSDFLADGLHIRRTPLGNLGLIALAFLPPLLIAMSDPRAFLTALEYAGAFGVVFLLGLMPALMVWKLRNKTREKSTYKAPGGKVVLSLVILFAVVAIGLEIVQKGSEWIRSGF